MLIGKWIEQEPEDIGQFSGTNHILEFRQDSFFLQRRYWTDALDPANPCLNGHTDYYKGLFEITTDSISFNGLYTDQTFQLTTPKCDYPPTYQETFAYQQNSDNVIILNPEEEIYLQIRLEREE